MKRKHRESARVRPVSMTAGTTFRFVAPLLPRHRYGSEVQRPPQVIAGWLSTILTLW